MNKIQSIVISLDREIERLISQGVTDFISGGAPGFEQMPAAMIIAKKEMGRRVRLIFALPCEHRERSWSREQKSLYHSILGEADEIIYVSKRYDPFCIRRQESYIAERCSYCICIITDTEAHRAIRFASEKGIKMINIDEVS
ncbi:MAG: SLOG family protein [Clostridiaceae bacterium]|nr:SLOG family protein [Clostridiaceae bacterium]